MSADVALLTLLAWLVAVGIFAWFAPGDASDDDDTR